MRLIFDQTPNAHRNMATRNRPWITRSPRESRFVQLYGEKCLADVLEASVAHPWPVPIIGTMCYAMDGMLIPDIRGAAFTSLSDLISEATGGKSQMIQFNKVGATGVVGGHNTLWDVGNVPALGAVGAALAAGSDQTRDTTGALGPQTNAGSGDTLHLTTGYLSASVASMTLLLYDRIWSGVPVLSSGFGVAQTVTSTLARYETTGSGGTSRGNFCMCEITTALPATAHGWTFEYTDDSGNAVETSPTVTGLSAGIAKRLDTATVNSYVAPLNAGDVGISDISKWTLTTANLASGAMNVVIGHPIGFLVTSLVNQMVVMDGINSAFNLQRIYDDACLALIEVNKPATTATTYTGMLQLVSG